MPTFSQDGEFYGVSYVTGPAHVFLQVAFSASPVEQLAFQILPPVVRAPEVPLDAHAIREAVLTAAAEENAKLGTEFFPAVVRYVEDDSPSYPIYGHCTRLLIQRLARGPTIGAKDVE